MWRSTVGYPSDSVASRVLELHIGYVLYMLSTAAGIMEVRGDTNASFSIGIGYRLVYFSELVYLAIFRLRTNYRLEH